MSKFTVQRARFLATVRRAELQYTQGYCARPGPERGYKVPGKKLKMRMAHEQIEAEQMKAHNRREYEARSREEARAMEEFYLKQYPELAEEPEDAHWRSVHRGMDRLPRRDRKAVERALLLNEIGFSRDSEPGVIAEGYILHLKPRVRKVFQAHLQAWNIERAMEWDRKTLANCY